MLRNTADVLLEAILMPNGNFETLLLVFVAVTGLAVLLQVVILFALFLSMRKAAKALNGQIEELRTTVLPLITEAKDLLSRVGPQVNSIMADVAKLTSDIRAQSADLHVSATDILERVRRQTSRVDAMLSSALDTVDRAGGMVSDAVNAPLRQISAIAAALKAGLGALRSRSEPRHLHSPADKDMFV